MSLLTEHPLASLVDLDHGMISREVFVNEEIYRAEQRQIFARAWLFVGHESQVPNPGDFLLSRMGEESVILVRDRQGTLHVFLNTCRHRGMKVCRYDQGNTLVFTCPFHGFSYDTAGRLVGVPRYEEVYKEDLDKSQWGLIEVAKLATFYGSIWATWDPEAPSFDEYLGGWNKALRVHLQSFAGEDAGLEALDGIEKWQMPCNWKFAAMSFGADGAHGAMTHKSTNVAGFGPEGLSGTGAMSGVRARPAKSWEYNEPGLGHGGRVAIYPPEQEYMPNWLELPAVDEYFRQAHEKWHARYRENPVEGEIFKPGIMLTFPNACMGGQPFQKYFFIFHPHGPHMTEVWKFWLVDKDMPPDIRDEVRRFNMRFAGPVGMTETDDMENWNYAHAASNGEIARRYPYNYQMGLSRDVNDNDTRRHTERGQRGRFAAWLNYMQSDNWSDIMRRVRNAQPIR